MSLPFATETLFAGILSIVTAASASLLAQVPLTTTPEVIESAMEMRLLLVPFLGGALMMLGAAFLNPGIETGQVKVGRACVGVFFAIVAPQLISWIIPGLKAVGTNPFMLLSIGGGAGLVGFILSRSAVQGLYNRSDRIAERALDKAEDKYLPPKPPSQ